MAGEILDLPHQVAEVAQGRVFRVEARLPDEGLVPLPVGHLPGQAVQAGGRDLQHLAHLPDGGPVAVADHVGHHGGVGAPVLLVHVPDHLFPAVVLDVQVDVRRLRPFPGNKTLEEEVHLGGVHAGDAQGEADGGIGRRSAALAEDLLAATEFHDLVHGQEIALVLQFPDQREFLLQLGDLRPELVAQALGRALEGALLQVLDGRLARRQMLQRVAVAQFREREGAAAGYLTRPFERRRVIAEEARYVFRSLQGVLVVRPDEAAGRGQRHPLPDAGQHVLQAPPFGRMVEDLHGGRGGKSEAVGQLPEADLLQGLLRPPVPGQEHIQAVSEGRAEGFQDGLGTADPKRDQPWTVSAHLLPAHPAVPLGSAQVPGGQQPAEMGVAFPVLHQQQDLRAVLEADLRSRDQVDVQLPGADVGPDDAVHAVSVGEGQGGNAHVPAGFDQFLGMAGPFQEGVVALAPEGRVGCLGRPVRRQPVHSTRPWTYQRFLRWS